MDRRDFISTVGSFGLVAALGGAAPARRSLVRDENQRPGTTDWILTKTRVDPESKYRCPWIEGYCSSTSVRPGETIDFKVSTNPPAKFTIDLYRMGYYGGKGSRFVKRFGPFQGSPQAEPPVGEARLRECAWETSMRLTIEPAWPSGVYLAKLTEQREKLQSYMIFIVRDDTCGRRPTAERLPAPTPASSLSPKTSFAALT
jgi:hypothetical protein